MKSKAGIFCIVLGVLLILGALALALWNHREDAAAAKSTEEIVPQLVQQIQENTAAENADMEAEIIPELQKPLELLTEEDKKMAEIGIGGHLYIGYLSIPALDLELPIMSKWTYEKLLIAPCRYSGSIRGEDLVLMAHNYKSHFGLLPSLDIGDSVYFIDMAGAVYSYLVSEKLVISGTDADKLAAGEWGLTLFTCTNSGKSRYIVRCKLQE